MDAPMFDHLEILLLAACAKLRDSDPGLAEALMDECAERRGKRCHYAAQSKTSLVVRHNDNRPKSNLSKEIS